VGVVEDAEGAVDDRLFSVGRGLFAEDGEEGGDHGVAAAVGVGEDLLPLLLLPRPTKSLGGVGGFAGVEDVQVSAATAEGDDLAAEGPDQVDVVGFQVPEDQWE